MDCILLLHLSWLIHCGKKRPSSLPHRACLCALLEIATFPPFFMLRSFTSFPYSKGHPHPHPANLTLCLYFSAQMSFQFIISSSFSHFLYQAYLRMILSGENVFSQPGRENGQLQMHRWMCMKTDLSCHLSYTEVSEKFLDFPEKTPKTRIRAPIFAIKSQTPLHYQFCCLYWLY